MEDVVMCHLSQPQENMAATPALVSLLCSWLLLTEALVPVGRLRIDSCLMWTGEWKFCQVTGQITLAVDWHKDATSEPCDFNLKLPHREM